MSLRWSPPRVGASGWIESSSFCLLAAQVKRSRSLLCECRLWVKRSSNRIGNVLSKRGNELFGHKDCVSRLQLSVFVHVLSVVNILQVQFLDFHPAGGRVMIEKDLCLSARNDPSRHGNGL